MKLTDAFKYEFKDVKSYSDFKSTVSSLDNLFYGLLMVGLGFMAATAPALFLIPVGFVAIMYVGRCISMLVDYVRAHIMVESCKIEQK